MLECILRVCACAPITEAAVELNDNGGGCGQDMKPEHGSLKRKKEPKERKKRKMKKENEGKRPMEKGEL